MARTARPSEVYRLPELQRPSAPAPPEPEGPGHRVPMWVGVAGLLAVVLVVSGLIRGGATTTTGEVPIVDIVSEDQAIAALGLFAAQIEVIDDLRGRGDIYAGHGPPGAARAAERGAHDVQQRLDTARSIPAPDRLAAAYYASGEHTQVLGALETMRVESRLIALLAATHETIYTGSGAIPLQQAYDEITGAFAGTSRPAPLATWAQALLEQMEERDRAATAAAARAASGQLWAARVEALQPGGVQLLRDYIGGLPAATVEALRGHPVAGPGLGYLERDQRQVSLSP